MAASQHGMPHGHLEQKFDDDIALDQVEKTRYAEGQFEIDPVVDRRVTRKFDTHIIPWLFAIWSVEGR